MVVIMKLTERVLAQIAMPHAKSGLNLISYGKIDRKGHPGVFVSMDDGKHWVSCPHRGLDVCELR